MNGSRRPQQRAYLVAVASALVFAIVAADVATRGIVTDADARIVQWFGLHTNAAVTSLMLIVAAVHSTAGILVMVAIVAAALWIARRGADVLLLLIAVPGAMLLNRLVKEAFARRRPHVPDPIVVLHGYSFPSGHAAASTAFYGFLAWYLVTRTTIPGRGGAPLVAVVLVVLVCACRMYLRVHYLSDVAGGIALAGAWLALCVARSPPR